MKKRDWIIIICVVAAAGLTGGWFFFTKEQGDRVIVTVNGSQFGTYDLNEEQTIDINGTNRLIIREGTAKMEFADCPDQLCVHQKAISKTGETIICLPNEVIVTVEGSGENELDAIVN